MGGALVSPFSFQGMRDKIEKAAQRLLLKHLSGACRVGVWFSKRLPKNMRFAYSEGQSWVRHQARLQNMKPVGKR